MQRKQGGFYVHWQRGIYKIVFRFLLISKSVRYFKYSYLELGKSYLKADFRNTFSKKISVYQHAREIAKFSLQTSNWLAKLNLPKFLNSYLELRKSYIKNNFRCALSKKICVHGYLHQRKIDKFKKLLSTGFQLASKSRSSKF